MLNIVEKIEAKCEPITESGCWLYFFVLKNKNDYIAPRRLLYEHYNGKILGKQRLFSKCNVECCVNPKHFNCGTRKGNVLQIDKETIARFWNKVAPKDKHGCMDWLGTKQKSGHGTFNDHTGTGRQVRAHRFSYILHFGEIPEGMCVLHKCDRGQCVAPDHLFLGTQDDNMKDMAKKKRSCLGSRNGQSKLTEKQVKEIRNINYSDMKRQEIADLYGITANHVTRLRASGRWNHLNQ